MQYIDPSVLNLQVPAECLAGNAWETPASPTGVTIIYITLKNIPESKPYVGTIYPGPNGERIYFCLEGE